ncbi:MAG TPA: hypothetical protein VGJ72_05070 [Polaromonas sp.]|jgi:beta-phosphoglucomutase-like phosphatase (HAD superfamily)
MSQQASAEAPKTHALIFDMGGTMADSMPWRNIGAPQAWMLVARKVHIHNELINNNFLGKLHAATA